MRILLLLISLVSFGCASAAEKVSTDKASKIIAEQKVQILDVRTEEEWKEGHLKDAIRVNFFDDDFRDQLAASLKKDQPVLVYCRSGRRSTQAAVTLENLGFKSVYNLDGGIVAWQKDDKPVVK